MLEHHRRNERKKLKDLFAAGRSVLMLAPRRVGKTWLLGKSYEDMTEAGWLCFKIDLEGKRSEAEFLRALCDKIEARLDVKEKLLNHLKLRFRQVSGGSKVGRLSDIVGVTDHREFLESLIHGLADEECNAVIYIDEIGLFINRIANKNPNDAASLLYHIRNLVQEYPKIRWFLTGSIGLDAISKRHGFEGATLGMELFEIQPFSSEEAKSYVSEVFSRFKSMQPFEFCDGAFEALVSELGWLSPFYLEHLIRAIEPSQEGMASIEDVETAIRSIVYNPNNQSLFAGWNEHIEKNYEKDETVLMHKILNILCKNKMGENEETIYSLCGDINITASRRDIKNALINLMKDAYIRRDNQYERWSFVSGVLRKYWLEYKSE